MDKKIFKITVREYYLLKLLIMKRILDAKRKITGTTKVQLKLICFIVLFTVISVIGADYNVPFDETNLISIRKYKPDNTLEDVCYYVKTQTIDRIPQPEPPKEGDQQ